MLRHEQELWDSGCLRLAGLDEAGRGPLAGPVVAAVWTAGRDFLTREQHGLLEGLRDSKKLTAAQRELFYERITSPAAGRFAVGVCDPPEIDALNILRATHSAMRAAVGALVAELDHVLVDGLPVRDLPCASTAIVGGDGRSLLIAGASVIAKVTRDRMMIELDARFPQYGFAANKGYGTPDHLDALQRLGPCPCHRRSFRPVSELVFRW